MGQKYSYDRGDHNAISFWLIFDAWGAVRLTRGEPDLNANERGMQMIAKLPHALFNRPQLHGTISVEAPATEPINIDLTAAAEALKEAIGIDIDLRVAPVSEAE
jgi:hypothetical protein